MSRKGNILILFVIIISGLAAFYFISDPFKTKVNMAISQTITWTPENIQKDSVGYLTWAKSECDRILDQLGAREIAIKTKKNEVERELLEKDVDLKALSELLDEAKILYRANVEKKSFPVSLRSIQLNEPQLKAKILESHQKIELLKNSIPVFKNTLSLLTQKIAETQGKSNEVSGLRRKIGNDIELAKLKKETSDLNGLHSELKNLLDTTSAVVQPDSIPSVDDLAKMQSQGQVDLEFEKILNSK
ncbi:MAG: hypothetical protein HQM08_27610 [Candidatus Riflebacteria bacterium]|nr:hypothetical protein [Candidatus Riflebacteria bacterium]